MQRRKRLDRSRFAAQVVRSWERGKGLPWPSRPTSIMKQMVERCCRMRIYHPTHILHSQNRGNPSNFILMLLMPPDFEKKIGLSQKIERYGLGSFNTASIFLKLILIGSCYDTQAVQTYTLKNSACRRVERPVVNDNLVNLGRKHSFNFWHVITYLI